MIKNIYTAITQNLRTNVPELKDIKLYNSQFDYLGLNSEGKKVEETLHFPCVLIEYVDEIGYGQLSLNCLFAEDVVVRLHIALETYTDEALEIFDLRDKVNYYMQGFHLSGNSFNRFQKIAERQDVNHRNVYNWQIDYRTAFKSIETIVYQNNPSVDLSATTVTGIIVSGITS